MRTASRTFSGGVPAGIREHELVNQLWSFSGICRDEFVPTPDVIDIQIPVGQQCVANSSRQSFSFVGFERELAVSLKVIEMSGHCLEVAAVAVEDLYQYLWDTLHGSPNMLDLDRSEFGIRPAAAIAHEVEERLPSRRLKGLLPHVPFPSL